MKKTLIIALAGMMLFAFTQCGGGKNENGKEGKAKTETKASKQFTEMKEAYDEVEKMIKDTKDCEELKEAAFAAPSCYIVASSLTGTPARRFPRPR